jgi:hypothetical protein
MSHLEENNVVLLSMFLNLYVGVDPSSGPLSYSTVGGFAAHISRIGFESGECEEWVQSTSKYFGASSEIFTVTLKHMETHLVQFKHIMMNSNVRKDASPASLQ